MITALDRIAEIEKLKAEIRRLKRQRRKHKPLRFGWPGFREAKA